MAVPLLCFGVVVRFATYTNTRHLRREEFGKHERICLEVPSAGTAVRAVSLKQPSELTITRTLVLAANSNRVSPAHFTIAFRILHYVRVREFLGIGQIDCVRGQDDMAVDCILQTGV
jgi:hypothetical protein